MRAGVAEFARATWQLDGFHLARAFWRALGSQAGRELYQALRTGKQAKAQTTLRDSPVREGKQAQQAFRWVEKVAQQNWGLDWRVRLALTLEEVHSLGCMEGNQAHLLAARMKGKGRSWSRAGASHMAKVQELLANDQVQPWYYWPLPNQIFPPPPPRHPPAQRLASSQGSHATVPAVYGPFPNAPGVQHLRQLIHPKRCLLI